MGSSMAGSRQMRLFSDSASFVVVLLIAWWARWSPGELAWGLWVSGFVVLMAWLLVMALLLVWQDGFAPMKTGGVLLAVGLTGCGLCWVYRFYGEMIDLGFPLLPDPGRVYMGGTTYRNVRPFELWPTVIAAMSEFYVMVAVSLLPMIPGLQRAWPDPDKFRMEPGLSGLSFARMHFTVMALAALEIFLRDDPAAHNFVFSAAILTINYFPWHVFAAAASTEPPHP